MIMRFSLTKGIKIVYGDTVPLEILETLRLLAKKWIMPIMYHLNIKNQGFADLKRAIGKSISSNMLSRTLEELQSNHLIEKRIVSTSPIRVEYSLPILGSDLCELMDSLGAFGQKYLSIQSSDTATEDTFADLSNGVK